MPTREVVARVRRRKSDTEKLLIDRKTIFKRSKEKMNKISEYIDNTQHEKGKKIKYLVLNDF